MEQDANQPASSLCQAGCGFYGSSATDGFCSKCFKENLKKRNDPGTNSTSHVAVEQPSGESSVPSVLLSSACCAASAEPNCSTADPQKLGISPSASEASMSTGDEGDLSGTSSPQTDSSSGKVGKKSNRCDLCKKKTGLTGFICRCGGNYCGSHRYSDMHQCTFDYRSLGQEEIRKNNPVVKAEKIGKL